MRSFKESIAIVIAMSVILAGCGGSGASSTTKQNGTITKTASQSTTVAKTESSAAVKSTTAAANKTASKNVDWPKKTIQIIVPFKAGGDSDFNARAYAQELEKQLGKPVVVVNVEGSGGSVGTKQVKDAAPDGYTVLANHTSFLINKANGTTDFGFEAFELVGITAANPGDIICVRTDSGITDLKSLQAAAKAKEGKMTISTTIGSTTQVSVNMIIDAGIPMTPVDVGNASDKTASLLGKHVDVIVNPYGNVKQYIQSGEFKALAVISRDDRCPSFPDIPTAKEQGFDINFPTRYFMAFPKGTDPAIVEKFRSACKKVEESDAEYAKMIKESYYQEPFFMDADKALEFYKGLEQTMSKYSLKKSN